MSKPDAASPREDNARALATGFISALSAVIGRRSSALGLAVSQMTTWPGSRTQMNAALSIVTVVKLMALAATPSAGSCEQRRVSVQRETRQEIGWARRRSGWARARRFAPPRLRHRPPSMRRPPRNPFWPAWKPGWKRIAKL